MWAWGSNYYSELGFGTGGNAGAHRSSPTQVGSLTNWSKVFIANTSAGSVLAIKNDGTLWGWGRDYWGTLGRNATAGSIPNTVTNSPIQIGAGTTWLTCEGGYGHFAALKTDGTLWLWGHGNYGQLGDNATNARSSPTQVGTGTNWSKISVGQFHTMAVKSDGTLWTWGNNGGGQLGFNDRVNRSSPVQVGTASSWAKSDGAGWLFVPRQ